MPVPDPSHLELLLSEEDLCCAPEPGMTVSVTEVQGHQDGFCQSMSGVGSLHVGVV